MKKETWELLREAVDDYSSNPTPEKKQRIDTLTEQNRGEMEGKFEKLSALFGEEYVEYAKETARNDFNNWKEQAKL